MESARITIGLIAATLLPHSLPFIRNNILACLSVSVAYGSWVISPLLATWRSPVLLLIIVVWSFVIWLVGASERSEQAIGKIDHRVKYRGPAKILRRRLVSIFPQTTGELSIAHSRVRNSLSSTVGRRAIILLSASSTTALLVAAIADADAIPSFFRRLGQDKEAIVVSGFLIAVLVCHVPVTYFSTRFIATPPGGQPSGDFSGEQADYFNLQDVSVYIGWFERALVFTFIVGGQAEAAAMALAAKSIARYPAIEHNPEFGRYFIVGTFASVLASTLCAIMVRLSLGLSPM